MTTSCPMLGFTSLTDLSVPGQPSIGTPIELIAMLHNLSPAGYASQPGQVAFRWAPFGWGGTEVCSLSLLTPAANSTNPALAIDLNYNTLIAPGQSLPASFWWMPDLSLLASGYSKGRIVCQSTALNDGQCAQSTTSCSPTSAANLVSGMVTVLNPNHAAMARQFVENFSGQAQAHLYFSFAIVNTMGIGARVRVNLQSFGYPLGPDDAKFYPGKGRTAIHAAFPSPPLPFHAGTLPKALFEDLIETKRDSDGTIGLDPLSAQQGLLAVTLPQNLGSRASLLRVTYEIMGASCEMRPTLGEFTIDLAQELALMRDPCAGCEERKAKL